MPYIIAAVLSGTGNFLVTMFLIATDLKAGIPVEWDVSIASWVMATALLTWLFGRVLAKQYSSDDADSQIS